MSLTSFPIPTPQAQSENLLAQIIVLLGGNSGWTYKVVSAVNAGGDPTRIDYYTANGGALVMHELITYDANGNFQTYERLTP